MKSKFILFFLISLFTFSARSQAVTDSTRIKLAQYKQLLDSGVIEQDEYDKKRSELLATPNTPAPVQSPVNTPAQPQAPPQTELSDSTRIKLDFYRKLLDNNDISLEEYNAKVAQLLGKPAPEIKQETKPEELFLSKVDTMPLSALKERYKSKMIAGSVILSVGTAFWVGDVLLAALSPKLDPKDSLYSDKLTTRRGSEIGLGVLGGVASIGGAVFLALGLKDRAVYRRRGKELTMNFTGKEIEIAFVF